MSASSGECEQTGHNSGRAAWPVGCELELSYRAGLSRLARTVLADGLVAAWQLESVDSQFVAYCASQLGGDLGWLESAAANVRANGLHIETYGHVR